MSLPREGALGDTNVMTCHKIFWKKKKKGQLDRQQEQQVPAQGFPRFVCAVVREGSGLFPGRHSWRTSSEGKWAQVHFLKCVLISKAWEAGNFTPGILA